MNSYSTVAEEVLNYIYCIGIKTLFVVPGNQVEELLIRAVEDGRFEIIVAAHEQGAGYMADGFARASGRAGCVITINGPGATNLITSAITAKFDYSQVLFITGDAPTFLKGFDAFQASNTKVSNVQEIFRQALSYSEHIAEHSYLPEVFNRIEEHLLLHHPVHINLPSNIAIQKVYEKYDALKKQRVLNEVIKPIWLEEIPKSLGKKAVIIVGEEIKDLSDLEAIIKFSEKYTIPIASTLAAKNIQPLLLAKYYLGVFGYAGSIRAFESIIDTDIETCLLFGVTLNERNTVAWHPQFFQPTRNIIRFSTQIDTACEYPIPIVDIFSSPKEAIYWLQQYWSTLDKEYDLRNEWIEALQSIPLVSFKEKVPKENTSLGMDMSDVVKVMNETFSDDTLLFLDSGDHRIYGATYWDVKQYNSFFTAANTAAMGWAIGAGIGASFANKSRQVCVLTGDGCMLMHGMEIAVAAKYKCQVVFIVSNNRLYGRIAARLKDDSVIEAIAELPDISWRDFSKSLGVPTCQVTTKEQLIYAIQEAQNTVGPYLIEMIVRPYQELPFPQTIFSSSSTDFIDKRQRN